MHRNRQVFGNVVLFDEGVDPVVIGGNIQPVFRELDRESDHLTTDALAIGSRRFRFRRTVILRVRATATGGHRCLTFCAVGLRYLTDRGPAAVGAGR